MNNIIYLDQPTAASMTTYKELIKLYRGKDPTKYEEAIAKNKARYRTSMDEVLSLGHSDHQRSLH